eukprot:CAMPEP_0180248266 /NCGR_PEP_ID=MMETSP0987-20121128/36622_1 /TAXON_ID=697907 /ORGANISM="non described non described, Strain CCMP2293" /LENGTH=206 /DNA_ID=CAMNT_0022216349 /DNA_START=223 /DNA_END=845 /DNA_ORIENTATION=-
MALRSQGGETAPRGAPGGQTGRSPAALSEALAAVLSWSAGGGLAVPLYGTKDPRGDSRLFMERQGGQTALAGTSKGGRGLGISSQSVGDKGQTATLLALTDGLSATLCCRRGEIMGHGPILLFQLPQILSVIKDPQGRHPAGARRAPSNVRRALSSSALLDTLPGGLRPTTPRRLPAEARRVPASSALLDTPPHGLHCTTSWSRPD